MSAIDGILGLLARFEPHGTLQTGRPAKRREAARSKGEPGPIAEKPVVRYAYEPFPGRTQYHTPFPGSLHPARCGAVQSQTRSVRLDMETATDVAMALSFASQHPDMGPVTPALLAWLATVTGMDSGNSRAGRWSVGLEPDTTNPGRLRQRVQLLPPHRERIPAPPTMAVIELAAEVWSHARFKGWIPDDPKAQDEWRRDCDRIAETALYALVSVSCCRRCSGTGLVEKQGQEPERCNACAGVGWVSIDRRTVAKALGKSRRDHAKTTEPAYRWALSVMLGRLQSLSYEARRALRGGP